MSVISIELPLDILLPSRFEVPLASPGDSSLTAGEAVLERGSGIRAAKDGDAVYGRVRGNERILGGVEFVGEVVCEEMV